MGMKTTIQQVKDLRCAYYGFEPSLILLVSYAKLCATSYVLIGAIRWLYAVAI